MTAAAPCSRLASLRALATVGLLVVLAGCADPDAETGETAPPPPVESVVERGPIELRVRATPGVITVGDKLTLAVVIEAPAAVDVEPPDPGETLGPFTVRAARRPPDVPGDGRRRWTHTYTLDTFASGLLEIPPLTVRFVDRRPGVATDGSDTPIEGELASEPLAVDVRSVLAGDETETDFRDIKNDVAVPVPVPPTVRWLAGVALLVALAALAAALLWWRRRRATGPPSAPVVPPHEWAFTELDALAAARLVEAGEFHEFYVRLSDVVRQYVERRFDLMAPERTTEEFLREARHSTVLGVEHRTLLAGFLRAADMVKFALHEPAPAECHAAFASARGFVAQTAPDVPPPDRPPPDGPATVTTNTDDGAASPGGVTPPAREEVPS